jgi:hypothetical protein
MGIGLETTRTLVEAFLRSKSGAVPDLAGGFSKRRVKSRTANCDVKAMIEQRWRNLAVIF